MRPGSWFKRDQLMSQESWWLSGSLEMFTLGALIVHVKPVFSWNRFASICSMNIYLTAAAAHFMTSQSVRPFRSSEEDFCFSYLQVYFPRSGAFRSSWLQRNLGNCGRMQLSLSSHRNTKPAAPGQNQAS